MWIDKLEFSVSAIFGLFGSWKYENHNEKIYVGHCIEWEYIRVKYFIVTVRCLLTGQ